MPTSRPGRRRSVIHVDKDVLGGIPVFRGTRVPIQSLFDHLEAGDSLTIFLDAFPSVSKAQAVAVLEEAGRKLIRNARSAG